MRGIPDLASTIFEIGCCLNGAFVLWFAFRRDRYLGLLVVVAMVWGYGIEAFNMRHSDAYYYNPFYIMLGTAPDKVPLAICMSWGAFFYASWLTTEWLPLKRFQKPFVAGLLVLMIDLALDPVAAQSKLVTRGFEECMGPGFETGAANGAGFWVWCVWPLENKAFWFGVPMGNYFGWMATIFGFSLSAHAIEHWFDPSRRRLLAQVGCLLGVLALSVPLTYGLLALYGASYVYLKIPEWYVFGASLIVPVWLASRAIRNTPRERLPDWSLIAMPLFAYVMCWGLFLFDGVVGRTGPALWATLIVVPVLGMALFTLPYAIGGRVSPRIRAAIERRKQTRATPVEAPSPERIDVTLPSGDRITLSVRMAGEGPAVVLCHGFPELSTSWSRQIAALADAGYRVIAPDQRGCGDSDRPEAVEAYGLGELAGDLVGLLDALEIERAVFVGHDFGGMVTWPLGVLHPDRVAGLVGVNTPYMSRTKSAPIARLRRWLLGFDRFLYMLWFQKPGVADPILQRDARLLYEKLFRGNVTPLYAAVRYMLTGNFNINPFAHLKSMPTVGLGLLSPSEVDDYVETFARSEFTGALNGYRNFDRNWRDFPGVGVDSISAPGLMVTAQLDPALTPSMARKMAPLVPNLTIQEIEWCGHWTPYDAPDELSAIMIEWLRSVHPR